MSEEDRKLSAYAAAFRQGVYRVRPHAKEASWKDFNAWMENYEPAVRENVGVILEGCRAYRGDAQVPVCCEGWLDTHVADFHRLAPHEIISWRKQLALYAARMFARCGGDRKGLKSVYVDYETGSVHMSVRPGFKLPKMTKLFAALQKKFEDQHVLLEAHPIKNKS